MNLIINSPLEGIARDATSHQELLMTLVITLIDLKDVVCTKNSRCVNFKKSLMNTLEIISWLR
jgi:hypothetical protein